MEARAKIRNPESWGLYSIRGSKKVGPKARTNGGLILSRRLPHTYWIERRHLKRCQWMGDLEKVPCSVISKWESLFIIVMAQEENETIELHLFSHGSRVEIHTFCMARAKKLKWSQIGSTSWHPAEIFRNIFYRKASFKYPRISSK